MYRTYLKRILDIIISFLGLVFLFPLMIFIAFVIKVDSPGEAIFKQKRLGVSQQEFIIYKFRTMVKNPYQIGGITSYEGDPRITRIGAFLRKTSLDETPQLINILKGDMSIIGPRPILKEEFDPFKSDQFFSKRYDVRPGLFCTVDIEHRATAPREMQFEMDARYVDGISLLLDVQVFFKTFFTVIKQKNVYNCDAEASSRKKTAQL